MVEQLSIVFMRLPRLRAMMRHQSLIQVLPQLLLWIGHCSEHSLHNHPPRLMRIRLKALALRACCLILFKQDKRGRYFKTRLHNPYIENIYFLPMILRMIRRPYRKGQPRNTRDNPSCRHICSPCYC